MSVPVPRQHTHRTFRAFRPDAFVNPRRLLRVARLPARFAHVELDPATLAQMQVNVATGCMNSLSPHVFWDEFCRGLMHPYPSRMLLALREGRALLHVLPEVDAMFGIPQSADDPPVVDVGYHQMRLIDAAATMHASLRVRFAGLMHKLGKATTPTEILPSHYKHEARAVPLLEAICQRYPVPEDCRDLALLVINEADRIHRASDVRAGAIASLLERVRALEQPERFEELLQVCNCDYLAYPWRPDPGYPKADRLRRALTAYASVPTARLTSDELLSARANAIAEALGSESGH